MIFTAKCCECASLAARLGASCFCAALEPLFGSGAFSEIPPGTAAVFPPATLVGRRGIVNVGVGRWVVEAEGSSCDA